MRVARKIANIEKTDIRRSDFRRSTQACFPLYQHRGFYFPQTDCCGSPQTIRWCRWSDRKPVGLPIRLKELKTFSCFPLYQHRGFYFPPSAEADGPPFSPERETFCMLPFCEAFAFFPLIKGMIKRLPCKEAVLSYP